MQSHILVVDDEAANRQLIEEVENASQIADSFTQDHFPTARLLREGDGEGRIIRCYCMMHGLRPVTHGGESAGRSAVKRKAPKDLPFPAAIRRSAEAAAPAAEAPTSEAGAE